MVERHVLVLRMSIGVRCVASLSRIEPGVLLRLVLLHELLDLSFYSLEVK